MSKKIENAVSEIVTPIVEGLGYELYDVEYSKESGELVVTIDSERGIGLEDCERVSRAIDEPLEINDPVAEAYMLCVSSPGIDRVLKKPRDYERAIGKSVDVKLYAKLEGKKEFTGTLKSYDGTVITLSVGGKQREFEQKQIAQARLHVEF